MKKVDLQAVFDKCQPDMPAVLKMFESLIEQEVEQAEYLHQELISHYSNLSLVDESQSVSDKKDLTKQQLKTLTDRYLEIRCHNKSMELKLQSIPAISEFAAEFGPPHGSPDYVEFCDIWPCPDDS